VAERRRPCCRRAPIVLLSVSLHAGAYTLLVRCIYIYICVCNLARRSTSRITHVSEPLRILPLTGNSFLPTTIVVCAGRVFRSSNSPRLYNTAAHIYIYKVNVHVIMKLLGGDIRVYYTYIYIYMRYAAGTAHARRRRGRKNELCQRNRIYGGGGVRRKDKTKKRLINISDTRPRKTHSPPPCPGLELSCIASS